MLKLMPSVVLTMLLLSVTSGESTEINDVLSNPREFVDRVVDVEGTVVQLVPVEASEASYYILRDDYGRTIRIRTFEDQPEVGRRYVVSGVVNLRPVNGEPFLGETERTTAGDLVLTTAGWPVYAGLVLVGLGIGGAAVVLRNRRRPASRESHTPAAPSRTPPRPRSEPPSRAASSLSESTKIIETGTMRVEFAEDTVVTPPGSLEIIDGEGRGQTFGLHGRPTEDGLETTLGRAEPSGEERFSHIHFKEPTVSRRQASVLLREGNYYLMNHARVNPTRVAGMALSSGETTELSDGCEIVVGEVRLRFHG